MCLIPAFIFAGERLSDYLHIEVAGQRRMVFGAIMIPSVLLISWFVWRMGSYIGRPAGDRAD